MELPSMVQRSGDTLIVRSVVSGNQLYLDQGAAAAHNNAVGGTTAHNPSSHHIQQLQMTQQGDNLSANALEQHLERYRAALVQQQQQQHQYDLQQQQHAAQQQAAAAHQQAMELKEEGLPQCKIKRNYSCGYCTYFTQNPRYHLTHLRDVHGEKIVINKCKLCLYASRHFQKLVRHMKMVHGCTDGVDGTHGQPRGKRGMSREARKRKLEQSVGLNSGGGSGINNVAPGLNVDGISKIPTYEQVKREMEIQRDRQAFNKQEEQKQQLSMLAAAYERELAAQREREFEARQQAQSVYEQEMQAAAVAAATAAAAAAAETQHQQSPQTISNSNGNNSSASNSHIGFQLPPAHQNPNASNSINIELSPSPTESVSSANGGDGSILSFTDEPTQNRLLKCSVCDFTTLFRAQLVDHELDEHCKTKFFRCEKCSYVTHIKARFSKHVKYHSMPMIKCVTCDFRTPYKWNLDRHMKNHGGAGPFKCAACDFTADIKQSLTVHEMNHHVPPVGHAAGMSLSRRRNKVGGTDICDDFLSDSTDVMEDHYNNNNLEDYDDGFLGPEPFSKKSKYEEETPTDLSQKGGSSDSSSVHNQSVNVKPKRPIPNLIPIPKGSILNLSGEYAASRSALTDIASLFLNDKQISEILHPLEKADPAQLSPTPTIVSNSSNASRSLLHKRPSQSVSLFDKMKSAAPNENLICPCGHMAKCLSESIIHRKTCKFAAIAEDDIEEEQDDPGDRLEIDFAEDDDKQSHSALNLSVTGSTRCQHCRHRCKSSADLLNHIKQCSEAKPCGNESLDSLSGESNTGRAGAADLSKEQHPMENRVFIWNKLPNSEAGQRENSQCSEEHAVASNGAESTRSNGHGIGSSSNEENSYYGVETAPGYGEVTKKMTPEEEAANSSLKKVYKCPHCSFWASTASRFHVHIVGHLNKKPFECSLCSYRSNWRWDITKHIRLKTIRDPSHKNARVLMNDETGRRNYTKYNKYITLMKVTEEDGDPKLMKSGEMTPNQVASLSFINDFNKNVMPNALTTTHLNGIKEDITLEPVPPKSIGASSDNQLADGLMRLPLLATMMNAAMTQQQHSGDQDQKNVTLITPSVTISAVKRSPPPLLKPSDDLIADVREEGNERKTYYKCRKCNFRHNNRDAVLAHVKVHYPDVNYPIVTATPTTPPKSAAINQQSLQVAVNPNLYMNKVLAAMCLSQQQQQTNSNTLIKANEQQHSILSAGLLQQAIQGVAPNSPLGELALALAGKTSAKTTASILEHGEQKANRNEASAQRPTSPTNAAKAHLTTSSAAANFGNNVVGAGTDSGASATSSSLQHLLTSPRSTSTSTAHSKRNHHNSPFVGGNGGGGVDIPTNSNKNLVMGALTTGIMNSANGNTGVFSQTPTGMGNTRTSSSPTSSPEAQHNNSSTAGHGNSTIVTTLPTTTTSAAKSAFASTDNRAQIGLIGASIGHGVHVIASSPRSATPPTAAVIGGAVGCIGDGVGNHSNGDSHCINGLVYGSNNSTLTCNITATTTTHTTTASGGAIGGGGSSGSSTTATSKSTITSSCNVSNSSAMASEATSAAMYAMTTAANANLTLSPPSSSSATAIAATNATKHLSSNKSCNNTSNLLANDSERRDPSPYRCGHCHQVSNWKHVIQRHCRLKHAGDIRIETLDRSSHGERHASPVYRPLGSGASNESAYGFTLKALQHHQQQQQQQLSHLNSNNNANNTAAHVNNSTEHNILPAPLAANAANAANTPQELHQAAAAYFAALRPTLGLNGDELMLHQQLQQNDQIEITRLPAATNNNNNNSNNSPHQQQQNSKCKQQKCPLCPYISESKSQMNYHISLHKPTQYECNMCTFVCAKKQHLSSHMRSVHQQQQQHSQLASAGNMMNKNLVGTSALNSMDFSMALQFAAAAQAQQDSAALTAPHAIDLTALKHKISAAQQQASMPAPSHQPPTQQHQLLPHQKQQSAQDNQPKCAMFCPKCPYRYLQKLNESSASARAELEEHLKCHAAQEQTTKHAFKCEFCDFKASHESHIQNHRYVHTQQYYNKFNELYKHIRENNEFPPPKLMQITSTKNVQTPEAVWIVDTELSEPCKEQQQHANISSSSVMAGQFDNANSLLKKQLESGNTLPAAMTAPIPPAQPPCTTPSPKAPAVDGDDSSHLPSTSASVATSDLANDAGSDIAFRAASPDPIEKCRHCPYETKNTTLYKAHLQHHICISDHKKAYTCEHCDYTDDMIEHIDEHTRLHFNAVEKLKSVEFFTSYDNLELSVEHADLSAEKVSENEGKALASQCAKIKQEYNNNNEENAVNENVVTKEKEGAAGERMDVDMAEMQQAARIGDNMKKPYNKIILYKNDGCLKIKKEPGKGGNGDHISDRLRRRASRSHMNTMTGAEYNNNNEEPNSLHQQPANHKTILVNAKTGQVISRN